MTWRRALRLEICIPSALRTPNRPLKIVFSNKLVSPRMCNFNLEKVHNIKYDLAHGMSVDTTLLTPE